MKTHDPKGAAGEKPEEEVTPFHEPREAEEIMAAHAGLSTGSREEGPSQQENQARFATE